MPSAATIPAKAPPRVRRDQELCQEIRRVFEENFQVYGARKIWRQLKREGVDVARCTVERLMRAMGLKGAIRGKPIKTTMSDKAAPCPSIRSIASFKAPAPNRALGVGLHLRCASSRMVRGAYDWNAMRKEDLRIAVSPAVRGYEPKRR